MPVVSNTSPLLNLALIGQLELIREQFGKVLIPSSVLAELRVDEALPGSHALRQAIQAGWIHVQPAKNRPLILSLERSLDLGEAEAIVLAIEVKANRLLLDERDGRQTAKSLGLPVTGILGILLRAKLENQLPSLRAAMEELQQKAGFRIASPLFEELLHQAGE
jgi:hypothetical protein